MKLHFESDLDFQLQANRGGLRFVSRPGSLPDRVHRHGGPVIGPRPARLRRERSRRRQPPLTLFDDEIFEQAVKGYLATTDRPVLAARNRQNCLFRLGSGREYRFSQQRRGIKAYRMSDYRKLVRMAELGLRFIVKPAVVVIA